MSGYGSNFSALAHPKGSRRDDRAARDAEHARESDEQDRKVWRRSEGRCEVRTAFKHPVSFTYRARCKRRAVHIHHRLGGHGRRDIGPSMMAENKLHVCAICHEDERTKQIRSITFIEANWAATVQWERV